MRATPFFLTKTSYSYLFSFPCVFLVWSMVLLLKLDDKYEKGLIYHPRRLMGRFKAQILSGTFLLILLTFFISHHWVHKSPAVYYPNKIDWSGLPVKGALVVLARENEVHDIRGTMIDIEDRFNAKHKYPWVILGDQPFSLRFQELVSSMAPGRVYFGQTQTWHEPSFIDIKKVENSMSQMANNGVYRGESLSWRKMARYVKVLIVMLTVSNHKSCGSKV